MPVSSGGTIARGAAAAAFATAVSRVSGFVRVAVLASVLGATFLANTYQTANTIPNIVFELIAAGALTSIFVPTFVRYLSEGRVDEGWGAFNAIASVAVVALIAVAAVVAVAAPSLMRLLTLGISDASLRADEIRLGTLFLRLFSPQIVFYGLITILTGALHAHRQFALPAIAPVVNNVVLIGIYLYFGARHGGSGSITAVGTGDVVWLGAGTTIGVGMWMFALVPRVHSLGWRFRFNLDLSHPAVGRAARLGVWALGYVESYSAGLIVVLVLANRIEGGVAAYQWALTIFLVPVSLFGIAIFQALFPALSEDIIKGERQVFLERLRDGLAMLGFLLVPVSAALLATARPIAVLTLDYGAMTDAGATLVGRALAGFAVGLPAYSAFLILTRAFYALGNTKVPTIANAIAVVMVNVAGAIMFFSLPANWEIAGLSFGHSAGFSLAVIGFIWYMSRHTGHLVDRSLLISTARALLAGAASFGVMALLRESFFPVDSKSEALVAVPITVVAGTVTYIGGSILLRSRELWRLVALFSGGSR